MATQLVMKKINKQQYDAEVHNLHKSRMVS